MRRIASIVPVIGCIASSAVAAQTPSGSPAVVRACEVLTKDLVEPFTENKAVLDLFPPEEETMEAGTACEWGIVRLQLYPGRGGRGSVPGNDFQPITDSGWNGFFHNNRDRYAELLVWTAKHSFTLQVSVPSGKTAEGIKADVVRLANTIIAKLP
jgi:hypothetical protein